MTVLTPNEELTGTKAQKKEILDRLARFRADPRRTLKLAERYPHLTFTTMDEVVEVVTALSEADSKVLAAGLELARDRLTELGYGLLPMERVFIAIAATTAQHGGFHHQLLAQRAPDDTQLPGYRYVQSAAVISLYGDLFGDAATEPGVTALDLVRGYLHDCFHYLTFRRYRLTTTGIHRSQHGINFRRESGSTYSARDPKGSSATRNLGIIMEGAFDQEATTIAREAALKAGVSCPAEGIDRYAYLDATGTGVRAEGDEPLVKAMNGYRRGVAAPYSGFLAEIGGSEATELHSLIIVASLDGDLGRLQSWLDQRYGPGEFTALFRAGAYADLRPRTPQSV